jgi:hypothetical protein
MTNCSAWSGGKETVNTWKKSRQIHDLIQLAPMECSERAINALFTVVTALNERIDSLEANLKREELRPQRQSPNARHQPRETARE